MRNILCIRFSSLGDVVLTTPVYHNLKRAWPDCRVTVATKAQFAGVLEGNPHVDRILTLEQGESLWHFIRRVRRERFDTVIDLHSNLRSHCVAFFSGSKVTARYRKAALARRLFVTRRQSDPELSRHTVDRYLDTLKQLDLTPERLPPQIFAQGAERADHPMKILLIQTAFLGDAVLTTPMFSAIKQGFPSARLDVLCTPEIRDVFSGNPDVHQLWVMDKHGKDKGTGALFRWAAQLNAARYDIAVIPHRSFRSALLAWLADIPKRIGFSNSQGRFFLTETVPFDWKTHDSERNLALLRALGLPESKPQMKVSRSDIALDFEKFAQEHRMTKGTPLVGMNPGSVWRTKRWLPEHFASVADQISREYGARVILFGGSKDAEAVDAVCAAMKEKPINLCGKTDIKTLSALIARCSLFVTNDSGPMHLACAENVPVVAIFGATTRELGFFPYGEKSAVVEVDLDCRPCALHGGNQCPLSHFKCMKNITPDMVMAPARRFLEESGFKTRP